MTRLVFFAAAIGLAALSTGCMVRAHSRAAYYGPGYHGGYYAPQAYYAPAPHAVYYGAPRARVHVAAPPAPVAAPPAAVAAPPTIVAAPPAGVPAQPIPQEM